MAEMERSVRSRQCLGSRRFATAAEMDAAVRAWAAARNPAKAGARWQFTTADARVKLRALYPLPEPRALPDIDRETDHYAVLGLGPSIVPRTNCHW